MQIAIMVYPGFTALDFIGPGLHPPLSSVVSIRHKPFPPTMRDYDAAG